jgi:AcrR family transcriptional regulator
MSAASSYRLDLKDKILKVAMQAFFSKGIRAVKMDDIAKMMSISKRTLYEIYADKKTLLYSGVKKREEEFSDHMAHFSEAEGYSVIDTLVEFAHCLMEYSGNINPVFYSDLHKYERVLNFLKQKHQTSQSQAYCFFQKGVQEGYFRPDIDYNLVILISNISRQEIKEQRLFKKFGMKEIFRSCVFVFIRGVCTPLGQTVLEKALENELFGND